MPALNEANVRHLLRRTEFIDRQSRVTELLGLGSLAAAVDNILAVPANPATVVFRSEDSNWERGQHLMQFWLDQMAHDAPKPMQEKMALFWHGHFVTAIDKVGTGPMREQIDLYRRDGLTNVRSLAKTMSLQVAMLRYLDNNENEAESPNQNFARELMELFLLEVGNYTEADVEAATAAWTGHGDDRHTDTYVWRDGLPKHPWEPMYHDNSVKQFLGRTINDGGAPQQHGDETIDVMLGNGTVPAGADNVANRNRPSRDVAAEFLSRKLWTEFAGSTPSPAIIAAMRDSLVANDFDITPWVRTMLNSAEFYHADVIAGLVRAPIDWMVSLMYCIDVRADVARTWLMEQAGQAPFNPPNVSGWKHNGYFVNASAMEARAQIIRGFNWLASREYWSDDDNGYVRLRGGNVTQAELVERTPWPERIPVMTSTEVVDKMLDLMELRLTPTTRQTVIDHVEAGSVWDRNDAVGLILLAPELHVA